jgi:uncharacterized protein YkwD
LAGENLAYGQFSSIFAHEGLMNSLGHRENILRKDYEYLGVGVAFNDESQPYYTENFFCEVNYPRMFRSTMKHRGITLILLINR